MSVSEIGQSETKLVEEGWGDDRTLWDPRLHLAGMRVVLLVRARRLPATEVRREPSKQVVTESGAVDQLDKEAVGDGVERLRDVHRYGYGPARGLLLVKPREHPSRDREQGLDGGVSRFKAVLGGASAQRLNNGREDELL